MAHQGKPTFPNATVGFRLPPQSSPETEQQPEQQPKSGQALHRLVFLRDSGATYRDQQKPPRLRRSASDEELQSSSSFVATIPVATTSPRMLVEQALAAANLALEAAAASSNRTKRQQRLGHAKQPDVTNSTNYSLHQSNYNSKKSVSFHPSVHVGLSYAAERAAARRAVARNLLPPICVRKLGKQEA